MVGVGKRGEEKEEGLERSSSFPLFFGSSSFYHGSTSISISISISIPTMILGAMSAYLLAGKPLCLFPPAPARLWGFCHLSVTPKFPVAYTGLLTPITSVSKKEEKTVYFESCC